MRGNSSGVAITPSEHDASLGSNCKRLRAPPSAAGPARTGKEERGFRKKNGRKGSGSKGVGGGGGGGGWGASENFGWGRVGLGGRRPDPGLFQTLLGRKPRRIKSEPASTSPDLDKESPARCPKA